MTPNTGAFDFTDGSDLGVTIRGVRFAHLLFERVVSYSKRTYVTLAVSETFEALATGLQGCQHRWARCRQRADSLTASRTSFL